MIIDSVFSAKLKTDQRRFFSFVGENIFFVLPHIAVLDGEEAILEHLDTVQVSQREGESVLVKSTQMFILCQKKTGIRQRIFSYTLWPSITHLCHLID